MDITASSEVSNETSVSDVDHAVALNTHPKQTKRHLHTIILNDFINLIVI